MRFVDVIDSTKDRLNNAIYLLICNEEVGGSIQLSSTKENQGVSARAITPSLLDCIVGFFELYMCEFFPVVRNRQGPYNPVYFFLY